VLIDFGLARGFVAGIAGSMTSSQSPHYSPPEQGQRRGDFRPALGQFKIEVQRLEVVNSKMKCNVVLPLPKKPVIMVTGKPRLGKTNSELGIVIVLTITCS
jgi:serine/threonine protein kinase